MGERCTVEGTVQSVIFQNEENGYTVLSLLTELGEVVTAEGCIPYAAPGEGIRGCGSPIPCTAGRSPASTWSGACPEKKRRW